MPPLWMVRPARCCVAVRVMEPPLAIIASGTAVVEPVSVPKVAVPEVFVNVEPADQVVTSVNVPLLVALPVTVSVAFVTEKVPALLIEPRVIVPPVLAAASRWRQAGCRRGEVAAAERVG